MAKWVCGGCGRIADKEIRHGTGQADFCGDEIRCGPWSNVTHVYRAGQEGFLHQVLDVPPAMAKDGLISGDVAALVNLRLCALPLEGDDEV